MGASVRPEGGITVTRKNFDVEGFKRAALAAGYPQSEIDAAVAMIPEGKTGFFEGLMQDNRRTDAIQRNAMLDAGAGVMNTLDRGASAINRAVGGSGEGGIFGRGRDFLQSKKVDVPAAENANAFTDTVDRMIGSAAVTVPIGTIASAALAPVSAATIGAGVGRAIAGSAMSQAAKNAIIAGASAVPGQFLGNVLVDPEDAISPSGIAMTAFGASAEALGAFLSTAKNLGKLADDPTSAVSKMDIQEEVQRFRKQFDEVLMYDPMDAVTGKRTPSGAKKVELEMPTVFRAKDMDLKNAGRTLFPGDEEFSYFQKEAGKLIEKRRGIERKIKSALAQMDESGMISQKRLEKLEALHTELRAVDGDYRTYVEPYLTESADLRNPLKKGALGGSVRYGRGAQPNFGGEYGGATEQFALPQRSGNSPNVPSSAVAIPGNTVGSSTASVTSPVPKTLDEAVSMANIDYNYKPQPTGITVRQRLQDRAIPLKDLHEHSYDVLSNLGATRKEAELALNVQPALPVLDENGVWNGASELVNIRPMKAIMDDAGADGYLLEALTKARRTLAQPDLDTGMAKEVAQKLVTESPKRIQGLADEIQKFSNFLIDYDVRMGRLSYEAGERMKMIPYAPLGRTGNTSAGGSFRAARTGSSKASLPVMEQLAEQAYQRIEQAKKNYAWQAFARKVDAAPDAYKGIMEPAGAFSFDKYAARIDDLAKQGYTVADAKEILKQEISGVLDKTDNTITIFDKGVGNRYKVNPALATTWTSMNPLETNMIQNAMRKISTPLRESVAFGLDLSGVGPAADAVMASAVDPGFRTILDPLRGAWNLLLKSDASQEAVRAGLQTGGRFRNDLFKLRTPATTTLQKITSPVKTLGNASEALNDFLRPISNASRMGLYLSQVRQGASPLQAATFANNALGNWSRVGANMRGWALATEFGNVGIQSQEAMIRAVKEAAKDPKKAASLLGVGISYITLPTIYHWAAAQGDEELNALRKSDNYDNWWYRRTDGSIGKMRKLGWGLAPVFGGGIEAGLDAWKDRDPKIAERFVESVLNSVMFNPVPISMQTGLGLMNDDRKILNPKEKIPVVPSSQASVAPVAQGDLGTSNIAKWGAQAFGISPYKTDYAMNSLLGTDTAELLKMFTGGNQGGFTKLPIFGRYQVSPRTQTEGSILFYDDLKKAQIVDKTLKELALKQDSAGYQKYLNENREYVGQYDALAGMAKDIGQVSTLLRMISADKEMTKEEKRKAEREYRGRLDEYFRNYAERRKEFREGLK